MESPTEPEYGAWASPLDLASQMIDTESEDRHAIIWIDEAPQFFDARRGMLTEVIKMLKQVTMLRKKKIRLLLTAISFDWIDRRLRDQANLLYNCWTTNRGITVNAIVHELATGNVPPWQRNSIRPQIKYWNTRAARNWYNTDELVNADAIIAANRTDPQVYMKDTDGNVTPVTLAQILGNEVADIVVKNEESEKPATIVSVMPEELAEIITDKYGIPAGKGRLKEWLIETGFPVNPNDGRFIVFAGVKDAA